MVHSKPISKHRVKTGFLVPKTNASFPCLSLVDNERNEFDITLEKYYVF